MSRVSSLRARADLALIFVALVWGATFVVVKDALEQVSTLLFLAVRFSVATAALALIFRGRRSSHQHLSPKREIRAGIIVGSCLFLGYVLQTAGLRFTTAAKTGFITGFYIPLVPIIGAVVYRKLPRLAEAAGIALATVGMALMTLQPGSFDVSQGDLLVLGCAFAFAAHIVVLGHYSKHVSFEKLTLYQIATGAAIAASTFWWVETPKWQFSGRVIFAIILTAFFATALAFAAQTWAQQFTTPTRTALIFSLEPVFAWVTAYLLAGEVLTGRVAWGALLILAGILLVEVRLSGSGTPNPTSGSQVANSGA